MFSKKLAKGVSVDVNDPLGCSMLPMLLENRLRYSPKDSGYLIWVFPKIGVPQNGWFILESPIKVDDLGVPLFSETSILEVPFPDTNIPRND